MLNRHGHGRTNAALVASVVVSVGLVMVPSSSASSGPVIELTGVFPGDESGPAYTYVPGGSASFQLTTVGGGETYKWMKGDLGSCLNGRGFGGSEISGATSPTYIGSLTSATDFGSYFVDVTVGETTVSSNCIDVLPSQGGPLTIPTPDPSLWAAGMNQSVFIALPDAVPGGTTFTATATYDPGSGSKTVSVGAYALPTTGTNGITGQVDDSVTLWVPLPEDALGTVTVNVSWSGGPEGGVAVSTTIAPVGNAGITVQQAAVDSRNISVTATSPKPEGALLPADEYATAFHVFDADTLAFIDPLRSGVQKSMITIDGSDFLRSVDPLVLPASALGRRIRVGFVTYYFPGGYKDADSTTIRYAALSDPILMQASSGSGDSGGGNGGGSSPATPVQTPATSTAEPSRPAVVAPTIANPAEVTAEQIGSFTPEQVALIPPEEFRQFPPQAIAALTPQQVAVLTPAQVNAIRPARAAALTPAAAAAMDPAQLAALRPASVRALSAATLAALDGAQLASLRPDAIARITPRVLRALSPAQLGALTSEQRAQLTPRQLRALSPLQRSALR